MLHGGGGVVAHAQIGDDQRALREGRARGCALRAQRLGFSPAAKKHKRIDQLVSGAGTLRMWAHVQAQECAQR